MFFSFSSGKNQDGIQCIFYIAFNTNVLRSTQRNCQWNSVSIRKNMPFNSQFGTVCRIFPG
ncbi:hypothetical protein LEP1GSC038_0661 [Leptospira weilii str. 2006001855]|uniref:Uncharacterized protein n=1 Tax=Leptospira weilii str. 2006001855 TaxID=996804 RepID=M6FFC8_9LEPT|nr:hypothetical protein LEP1GSC038_0661 [Leptospira weilii str. 2006001855]